MSNNGSSIAATGIRLNNLSGNVTNKGTVKATASVTALNAGAETIQIKARGFVVATLMKSGNILNSGLISVEASNAANTGTRANAVGVSVGKLVENFTNKDVINADAASADGTGIAQGIRVNNVTGNIKNTGTISVLATGTKATATGIGVNNTLKGNFTNAGTVKVSALARTTSATARGIRVGTASGNVSLNNGGLISVKATGLGSTADARAVGVNISNRLTGTLKNAGTINVRAKQVGATSETGAGVSATGIFVSASATGKVVNAGKITAVASMNPATNPAAETAVAVGIKIQSLSAFGGATNSGAIKVTGKVTSAAPSLKITAAGIRVVVSASGTTNHAYPVNTHTH